MEAPMEESAKRFGAIVLAMHFFDPKKVGELKKFFEEASHGMNGKLSSHKLKSISMSGHLKISSENARLITQNDLSFFKIGRGIDREITALGKKTADEISFQLTNGCRLFLLTLHIHQIPFPEDVPKEKIHHEDSYHEALLEIIEK